MENLLLCIHIVAIALLAIALILAALAMAVYKKEYRDITRQVRDLLTEIENAKRRSQPKREPKQ